MWPTQSYFRSLLSMLQLVDQPRYFKATRKTLTNPSLGELTYPLRVTLLVCRVSGNPLSSAEFSTEVASVVLSSWRKSTVKQYNVYLEKWSTFCLSRRSHFMRASVSLILDFLHYLYTKGYGYSSLNTARSAISALYSTDKTDFGQNIGKHRLICRFLKGVFNEIPPTPKFQVVWPVEQVLAYLEQLTPLHALNLKELALKLVMPIALVTGQRCQTLSFLDISGENMKKVPTHFSFSLSEHLKQDIPGHVFGNVRLFQ